MCTQRLSNLHKQGQNGNISELYLLLEVTINKILHQKSSNIEGIQLDL